MRPLLLLALLFAPLVAPAETPAARPVTMEEFVDEVSRGNLDLAARRFDVSIAEAQVALARLVPDPSATVSVSPLNSPGAPVTTSVGVAGTIELGGKRRARVGEAAAGRTLAEARLEDFFQTIRTSAAGAFVDALAARQVRDRKRRTLGRVETLVSATEERLRAGDVSPAALWQVKVEADRFRADVIAAEGAVEAADLALRQFLAPAAAGEPPAVVPSGDLDVPVRTFDAGALVARAVEARSDLVAARKAADVADAHVGVARANRWIDPTLGAAWSHTTAASGSYAVIAPSQPFDGLGLSVALPIPFSKLSHGELDAARAAARQAETEARAARHAVEIDVRQALVRYDAARRALELYAGEVLGNADKVLEATSYSYVHGSARLLELLDAQRTADDVYLGYAAALAEHARALVALERASGLWDLDFRPEASR